MLVWGGRNGSGLLNDGALYDPSTDTWTPLPTLNAPAERFGAAAVWVNGRFVVWGGTGLFGPRNDGAQLVFVDGIPSHWQNISTTGAPGGRSGHTLIAAGTKALVFGGQFNSTLFADGAVYDPIADSWTALSTTDAPSARTGHAAVWTGSEMLILGGTTVSGDTATGHAYDLANHSWRTLSTNGAPVARTALTANWIGSHVLTFGGTSSGTPLTALQKLNPQAAYFFYRKP